MTVRGVAFVPSSPLLVPELAGAAAGELEEVRAVADVAVRETCAVEGGGLPVIVIGSGQAERTYDGDLAGTLRPWGVDVRVGDPAGEQAVDLPLSLVVGAWCLDRAGVEGPRRTYHAVALGDAADLSIPTDDCVLLVVGDGSATRTPKAPGSYVPEAESFDAQVASALGSGDPAVLAALDAAVGHRVMADAIAVWRAVGAALTGRRYAARLLAIDAPYGVAYLVATWL